MVTAPKAPDPYQVAAAQTQSNLATAKSQQELNMTNQSNPWGSLSYSQTGTNADGTPQYTQTTSLSPTGEKLTDIGSSLVNGGQGAFSGKGLDLSYDGTAGRLDALNKARLDPQWQQNTDTQEAKLAAQGLRPGMPGYDSAMRVFNQGKNDAYNSANLADYQTAAQAAQAEYNSPLATYSALRTAATPTFGATPTANVAGTNISGLIEQNYQQQAQNANATNGALGGLAGTALGSVFSIPGLGGMFSGGGGGGLYNPSSAQQSYWNQGYTGPTQS